MGIIELRVLDRANYPVIPVHRIQLPPRYAKRMIAARVVPQRNYCLRAMAEAIKADDVFHMNSGLNIIEAENFSVRPANDDNACRSIVLSPHGRDRRPMPSSQQFGDGLRCQS